jgi:hypothetical protein
MKPLYLTRASIEKRYEKEVGLEMVKEGNEIVFFITRDVPIMVTAYETADHRKLVGEACYVSTPAANHGMLIVGSVDWVAKEIRTHFESPE